MENKSFFHTKAGGLTIAFLVIMVAFVIIMGGLYTENNVVCLTGFVLIVLGMLYSPVKVYILDRLKK
jgi:membrane-bound ClpP family serine protease